MKYLLQLMVMVTLSLSAMAEIKITPDYLDEGENAFITLTATVQRGWVGKKVFVEALEDIDLPNPVPVEWIFQGRLKLLKAVTRAALPTQVLPWDSTKGSVYHPDTGQWVFHNYFGPSNNGSFNILGTAVTSEEQFTQLGGIANVLSSPASVKYDNHLFSTTEVDFEGYISDRMDVTRVESITISKQNSVLITNGLNSLVGTYTKHDRDDGIEFINENGAKFKIVGTSWVYSIYQIILPDGRALPKGHIGGLGYNLIQLPNLSIAVTLN